jgi:hypothetical protein
MTLSGRCAAFCAGFVLSMGCLTAPSLAQSAPPFDPTAETIPSTAVIDSWVDTQVKEFSSGDRDKVVAARQALSLPNSTGKKSERFLQVYGKAVGTKLLPVANSNDAHARLNAAMVAGRVADMGATGEIIPLIVEFINDESAGVSLYGIRGSASLIPRALAAPNTPGADTIVPAIAGAVKRHATSEAIAAESYQALIRVLNTNNNGLPPNVVTAATPRVIEGLLQLLEQRVSAFGAGDVVEPYAEGPAVVFLAKTSSWAAMSEQTRTRTVKTLVDLANGGVGELAAENNRKPTPNRARLQAIQRLLKEAIGQSLTVIANQVKNPALATEQDRLKNLNILSAQAQWEQAIAEITAAYSKAFKINSAPASQPAK